jgi:exonuclease VII large subunit
MQRPVLVLACAPLVLLWGCDGGDSHAAAPTTEAASPAPAGAGRAPAPSTEPAAPAADEPAASPTVPASQGTPEPVAAPAAGETDAAEDAASLRAEFATAAEKRLDELRESFEGLARQIDEKGEQAPEAWRQLKKDLQVAVDSAQARFDSLRSAASDQWEVARGELNEALAGLEERIEEARKTITSG